MLIAAKSLVRTVSPPSPRPTTRYCPACRLDVIYPGVVFDSRRPCDQRTGRLAGPLSLTSSPVRRRVHSRDVGPRGREQGRADLGVTRRSGGAGSIPVRRIRLTKTAGAPVCRAAGRNSHRGGSIRDACAADGLEGRPEPDDPPATERRRPEGRPESGEQFAAEGRRLEGRTEPAGPAPRGDHGGRAWRGVEESGR